MAAVEPRSAHSSSCNTSSRTARQTNRCSSSSTSTMARLAQIVVASALMLGSSLAFIVGPVAPSLPARRATVAPKMAAIAVEEVMPKVQEIVSEQLGVDQTSVLPESDFQGDLGADSLDTVELVMALEEGFGVSIEEDEAQEIKTVQDAADFITTKC